MHFSQGRKPSRSYLGEAVVDQVIHQTRSWRVKFQGTYWTAQSNQAVTLIPGNLVRVVGRRNIGLIVEPL